MYSLRWCSNHRSVPSKLEALRWTIALFKALCCNIDKRTLTASSPLPRYNSLPETLFCSRQTHSCRIFYIQCSANPFARSGVHYRHSQCTAPRWYDVRQVDNRIESVSRRSRTDTKLGNPQIQTLPPDPARPADRSQLG